jgi:hypothetical protein
VASHLPTRLSVSGGLSMDANDSNPKTTASPWVIRYNALFSHSSDAFFIRTVVPIFVFNINNNRVAALFRYLGAGENCTAVK